MSSGKNDTTRKGSEELLDLALKNIEEDRKRLIGFLDSATSNDDPLVVATVAENIAKITDVLTKQNMQVVEMAKIRKKAGGGPDEGKDEDGPLTAGEHAEIYKQIEEKGMHS